MIISIPREAVIEIPLEALKVGGWTFAPTLNIKGAIYVIRRAGKSLGYDLQVRPLVHDGYLGVSIYRAG